MFPIAAKSLASFVYNVSTSFGGNLFAPLTNRKTDLQSYLDQIKLQKFRKTLLNLHREGVWLMDEDCADDKGNCVLEIGSDGIRVYHEAYGDIALTEYEYRRIRKIKVERTSDDERVAVEIVMKKKKKGMNEGRTLQMPRRYAEALISKMRGKELFE